MNNKALALEKMQEMKKLAVKRQALLREKKLRDNPAMGIALLLEGDLEQAEIALAVQSMEDDIQSMAEKVAKMKVEELMPLTDRVREQFGTDKAEAFDTSVEQTLDTLLDSLKATREALSIQSLVIQGKADEAEMSAMATDDVDGGDIDLGDMGGDMEGDGGEDEIDDLFGGSDEASGPSDEPLGRARKESAKNKKPVLETKKKIYEGDVELEDLIKLILEADNELEMELLADRYGYLYEEVQEYIESQKATESAEKLRRINTPGSAMREALGIEEDIADIALTAAKWIPSPLAPIAQAADMMGVFDDDKDDAAPKTAADTAADAEEEKLRKMPMVKQAINKVTAKVAQNPKIKKVADTLGVDDKEAATLVTNSIEYTVPILEHNIVEVSEDSEMRESEAVTLLKAKMSTARAGKSIAETEAFDGGLTLSTPRSLLKQLTKKYGSPENWQIAENDEGGYYVISERMPETLRAKELEEQLIELDAQSASLREEYGDIEEDYKLPQEIRAGKLRDQLKEFVQGYHHPVARWCTMDEARSIVALGRRWFGKSA